jgi:hypothetical protein
MIDITGVDRVELLRCLHNKTQALGMGVLHDIGRDMTYAEAKTIWEYMSGTKDGAGDADAEVFFDYIYGRPIKVRIFKDILESEDLYDRDTYSGACQDIVDEIKTRPSP